MNNNGRKRSRGIGKQRCPTALGELAKELGVPKNRLYVLAPQNEPFNAGTAVDRELAQWFADIYAQYGFGKGVHLRHIHYRVASLEGKIIIPGNGPYLNTDKSWNDLQKAAKKARHLELVNPSVFEDRRNPQPKLYAPELSQPVDPNWHIDDFDGIRVPTVETCLEVSCEVPGIYVDGYDYDSGHQPYQLEVWIEKTATEEIDEVCQKYRANLVPALGTQSITAAIRMLERAKEWMEDNRPIRIWYISDFDPAGKTMPTAVARQLEFWMHKYDIQADVKLKPLVLTKAQVIEYKLPRKPIKESEFRRHRFEERYGEGATELDALEALHPGEMDRLLEEELKQYRDDSLQERMQDAEYEAEHRAQDFWNHATMDIRNTIDDLVSDAQAVLEKYQPKLAALSDEMEGELAPIREEIEQTQAELEDEIQDAADSLELDLPEHPEAEIDPPDESDWLFDSNRSFLEPTDIYRAHKEGRFQA